MEDGDQDHHGDQDHPGASLVRVEDMALIHLGDHQTMTIGQVESLERVEEDPMTGTAGNSFP